MSETRLEAYMPSDSQEGVFWRVRLGFRQGRLTLECTCPGGRNRPGIVLPCKHAQRLVEESTIELRGSAAPIAPGHGRDGRPIYPPNVRGLVD